MLTGKDLGAAIEAARLKKGVTKRALAQHFDVEPPSIQDWVRRGTIEKAKLPKLWAYFSDVVGLDHWGLESAEAQALRTGGSQSSLSQALLQVEAAVLEVAPHARTELLDAIAMWVKHGSKYRQPVEALLQPTPQKRQDAA